MAGKRAIQRLVVGDDGRLRTILIDLATLEPVLDPTGYYVVNQGETEPEPVSDVDNPAVVTEPPAPSGTTSRGENDGRDALVNSADPRGSFPSAPARDTGASVARKALDQAVSTTTNTDTPPSGNSTTRARQAIQDNQQALAPTGPYNPTETAPTPSAKPSPTGFVGGMAKNPLGIGNYKESYGPNRPNRPDEGLIGNIQKSVSNVYGPEATTVGTSGMGDYGAPGRHDVGKALDFDVEKDGIRQTNDVAQQDVAMDFAARNPGAGIGYGKGYMTPGRMHLDTSGLGKQWGAFGTKRTLDPNFAENLDFARQTGIGPTPTFGAPTPSAKPAGQPLGFVSQDERNQDKTVAEQTIAEAKDVTAPMMGFAGGGINRPSAPGAKVVADKTITGTTVTDDGYTETSRTGTRGWRNNNPGNIRAGDFALAQGAIGQDAINANGTFAVFGSYEEGRKAKESLVFGSKNYKDLSIKEAINRYAPDFENDTKNYISQITNALGVPSSTKLADLDQDQRNTMLDTMAAVEGSNRPGKETKNQHTYSGSPFSGDRDSPSEKSGGRFGGGGLGYSSKGGSDSPSEGGSRFGGGGLGSDYSGGGKSGKADSPSEGGGRFGGKGLGNAGKTSSQTGGSYGNSGTGSGGMKGGKGGMVSGENAGKSSKSGKSGKSKSSPTNDGYSGSKSPGGGF